MTDSAAPATAIQHTPLHALHLELGARMVEFAGYDMPVSYPAGVLAEHKHCRAAAGVVTASAAAATPSRVVIRVRIEEPPREASWTTDGRASSRRRPRRERYAARRGAVKFNRAPMSDLKTR